MCTTSRRARVGVRCDSAVAAGREIARGDRVTGMAASQAEVVHQGVAYDLQVDTTHTEALAYARAIAARVHCPRRRRSTIRNRAHHNHSPSDARILESLVMELHQLE